MSYMFYSFTRGFNVCYIDVTCLWVELSIHFSKTHGFVFVFAFLPSSMGVMGEVLLFLDIFIYSFASSTQCHKTGRYCLTVVAILYFEYL